VCSRISGTQLGRRLPETLNLAITNEELANAAAITLFDASRFMSDWQRSGALAKTSGKVLVRSPEWLFREVRK